MTAGICQKCRGLTDGAALCARCHAIDELLLSSDVLHDQVARALSSWSSLGERVLAQSALVRHKAAAAQVRRLL